MKYTIPSLLLSCLTLFACGKLESPKKDVRGRSQGAVVSGAGLTTVNCVAMSTRGATDMSQIQDQQDLNGFTACSTNDPSTIKLVYNNYMYNQYAGTLTFSAISGDNQQSSNFTINSGSTSVFVKMPGVTNSVYVILTKDLGNFGEGTSAVYAWANLR